MFSAFPALRIWKLYIIWGWHNWKFSWHSPRGVQYGNGIWDAEAVNLGKISMLWQSPAKQALA
jgi:hypothetical protein